MSNCVEVAEDGRKSKMYLPRDKLETVLATLGVSLDEKEAHDLSLEFDSTRECINGVYLDELERLLRRPTRLEEWIGSLPVSQVIADAFPQKRGSDQLRSSIDLSSEESSAFFEALRVSIERVLRAALADLKEAFRVTDSRGRADGGCKFSIATLSCGQISDFHAGIEARIGVRGPALRATARPRQGRPIARSYTYIRMCRDFDGTVRGAPFPYPAPQGRRVQSPETRPQR